MQLEYDPETDTISAASNKESSDDVPSWDRAWDNTHDVEQMMREASASPEWSNLGAERFTPDAPPPDTQPHQFNPGSYDFDPYNELYQRGVPDEIDRRKAELGRELTPDELQSVMSYYNELPAGQPEPPAESAPERRPYEEDATYRKRYDDWYAARQKVLEGNQGLVPVIATYTVLDWIWRLFGLGSFTDWSKGGYKP